jgi:hypothetical protein
MRYIAAALAFATAVAGHGYVNNATIGGKDYTFYQPYQDPYMTPKPERISREIQGNGPVEDVTSPDLQCGGYCKKRTLLSRGGSYSQAPSCWWHNREFAGCTPCTSLCGIRRRALLVRYARANRDPSCTNTNKRTLWPDSHVGPSITYMAKCPESGCNSWQPGTSYVFHLSPHTLGTDTSLARSGSKSRRQVARVLPAPGAPRLL